MLELARRFGSVSSSVHAGVWDREAAMGTELYGQTLGIVGLGDIGVRLAKRAQAFGMRLLAHDPAVHASTFAVQDYGVTLCNLDKLLNEADFVSLHVPLLDSTRHLLNKERLEQMKPSAYLINTARGGLVDESALARALQEGKLAGAALDVREQEPPPQPDPLSGLKNLILTPHIAGVTEASLERAALHVSEDVLRVLRGERPISPV